MTDKFKIFCARREDVRYASACVRLKFYTFETGKHIFRDADSICIKNIDKYDKLCFVQLQRFDRNYCNSHSGISECYESKICGYNCIFLSEHYRKKLCVETNDIVELEIVPNNKSCIGFFYPLMIGLGHPEIVFRCMLKLTFLGIFITIFLA